MTRRSKAAGGTGALISTLKHLSRHTGVVGGMRALLDMNQEAGFDCPGCAWPEPAHRSAFEFCENGAKAAAFEGTRGRTDPNFFAAHSIAELAAMDDYALEGQGRLVVPMHRAPEASHYVPIPWEAAFERIGTQLRALPSPERACLYPSGRASNEAAFLYQLLARRLGTNNLPDCSNMCHESSGSGLTSSIGIGKGTVSLDDFALADAIFVFGQNPGTNHPRMLTALQQAKRRGARIVSINPLREVGLERFSHPQEPLALLGKSEAISDLYLQPQTGSDVAVVRALCKLLLERKRAGEPSGIDDEFIAEHTDGFDALEASLQAAELQAMLECCGLPREQLEAMADIYAQSKRLIVCWAMGITQHENGVDNVRELVNLLLLGGHMGRPGAGACPVRGHSNVQGDRTMGIWERPETAFLEALGEHFEFSPPSQHGLDVVGSIAAMQAGDIDVFVSLGGNFAAATPDSRCTAEGLRRCKLTVHIATKLNRSHVLPGEESLLLPCLGRSERDLHGDTLRFVTVEDSMSVVHRSVGRRAPAADTLRSEIAIVCGMAEATFGPEDATAWGELAEDYDAIRDHIAAVIPGFEDFNARVLTPGGFVLPSGARERRFETDSGRAQFSVHALPDLRVPEGTLRLMTIRSHDQFNTTIYGLDDRYRGVRGKRKVVFISEEDMRALGFQPGERVDVHGPDGEGGSVRCVTDFELVPYALPRGCVAAYFPEANPLVPLSHVARESRTPAYKNVPVRLSRRPQRRATPGPTGSSS